jgi:hypothetical protein
VVFSRAPNCRPASPQSCRARSSDQKNQSHRWCQIKALREVVARRPPFRMNMNQLRSILAICAPEATVKSFYLHSS